MPWNLPENQPPPEGHEKPKRRPMDQLGSLAKNPGIKLPDLKVCCEAGPSGFVLARRLRQLKVDCVVMPPSKTERDPIERIKSDKRDAKKIAKPFHNGDITEVRIPLPLFPNPISIPSPPSVS